VPGTTRDALDEPLLVDGRAISLVDTAGWLTAAEGLDRDAIASATELIAAASLGDRLFGPDARLPTLILRPKRAPW